MLKEICDSFYKAILVKERYKFILTGIENTLAISLISVIIGVVIGVIIAIINSYNKETKKAKILSKFCKLYVSIIRGTPVLLQLMIIYYVALKDVRDLNLILVAALAFGINSGAYVAEIVRGGIMSVDIGQTEAGRSLGLSKTKTMMKIVLPQAFKFSIPALVNQFIITVKDSSILSVIGLADVVNQAKVYVGKTYAFFPTYITVAAYYLVVISILMVVSKIVEKKMSYDKKS